MPIPWVQMIKLAPTILSLAQDLRQRARKIEARGEESDDARLREMEADLKQQAELLHALAKQMEGLTAALVSLRRSLALSFALGAAAMLLAFAALILLLR